MDINLIKVNRGEALQAFRQYREAVRERHTDEYAALMHGYKALMKGFAVLDLVDAMKRAGLDAQKRPRLAIARASAKRVYCRVSIEGEAHFCIDRNFYRVMKRCCVRLPKDTFGRFPVNEKYPRWHPGEHRAVVPLIPAALLPKPDLRNYHILWEAEWETVPHDPLLLRHLHGALYAVLASWNLTPLEQAVLKGRLIQ